MPVFGHRTKYHMALVQHLRNQKYYDFFAQKMEDGETVILDNGAYEGTQVRDIELATWATRLRPSVVVLPDCPHNAHDTLRRSLNYLDKYGMPNEAMMVLHASAVRQFEAMYSLCPTKWIGFSRLTSRRAEIARLLKETGQWRQNLLHHALGQQADFAELAKMGFESCDSSMPIWRGLHGYSLTDHWPNYSFTPECAPEVNNLIQAGKNLDFILEECGEDRSGNDIEVARA